MTRRIRSANAEYQVLAALRTNRDKRNRENAFLVEGVRNIDAALAHRWIVRSVLTPPGPRSSWAASVVERVDDHAEVDVALFAALTDRDEPPEAMLVVEKRRVALDDLVVGPGFVATVLDRPSSPGNIGTIVRTSDALGGQAVIVTGHGADPYDPRSVRATTGSFFATPIAEAQNATALQEWAAAQNVTLVATDEAGDTALDALPSPPVAYLMGNETTGLSRGLREAATCTLAIPMTGTASSLNVAAAHAIVLHAATAASRATDRRG